MRVLIAILALLVASPWAMAQEKVRGDYEALKGMPEKHSVDKVRFEEFINFGCPHCNNFYSLSRDMRESYKGRVDFIDIPILFRGQDDAPLRLYYVAKSIGKENMVKHALFETRFKHNVNVFDPGVVNYLARTLDLGDVYRKQKDSPEVERALQEGQMLASRYRVNATPTIVLEGTLKMNIGSSMENFAEKLPETLDDLLKP